MPGTLGIVSGTLVRGSGATLAGLIQGNDGNNITQASLSAIAYVVNRIDSSTVTTQTGSGSITISSAVSDTPVTNDPRYPIAGGRNFIFTAPASAFLVPGKLHQIIVTFTPVSGEPFNQIWQGVPL